MADAVFGVYNPECRKSRERRTSPRSAASGTVEIVVEVPLRSVIQAELIESSPGGFRAVHNSALLEAGLIVNYKSASSAGRARIIWTHLLQGRRVSGFAIAQEPLNDRVR
jgi:hypothetical protein